MNSTIQQPQLHDIYFPEHKKGHMNYVVQQSTDEGIGEMICYDVAHGIQITYNDLKMDSCYRPLVPQKDFLQIDHCMEGCYEFERRGFICQQSLQRKAVICWITDSAEKVSWNNGIIGN